MASGRICSLSNKEAITIILWYMMIVCVSLSTIELVYLRTDIIVRVVIFCSIIILYSILGLFADIFIRRYSLIQFGLWVQWITVLISTIIIAVSEYYQIYEWVKTLLSSILHFMQLLGLSSFQVVALQFGTDQLQGAPSDHLSAFIFWYFMMEMLPGMVFNWIRYLFTFSSIGPANTKKITYFGWNVFSAVFVSVLLSIKSCFMFNWFSEGERMPNDTPSRDTRSGNPYCLTYRVLRYAQKHKHPVQRSALTYWEDNIPSRTDLGKSKYGGPFTNEEVENVKTFLQLIKLLFSLSGILVTSRLASPVLDHNISNHFSHGKSDTTPIVLIEALCSTVTIVFLMFSYIISPYLRRYLPSMLKRIGIAALLTTLCVLSFLLIDSLGHAAKTYKVPCFFSHSDITLNLSPYVLIIPHILYNLSYMIFTISLFEFIIAQSPHSMKGILIGFCYIIRYGLSGLLALVAYSAFRIYPDYSTSLSCETVHYLIVTTIALLSLISYTIVACKYKLRERDEVINFHAFAENYYES